MNPQELTISQAVKTLISCMRADIPMLMLGSPGMGKTEVAVQVAEMVAKSKEFDFEEIIFLIPSQEFPVYHTRTVVTDCGEKLKFVYTDKIPLDKKCFIIVDEAADLNPLDAAIWNALIYSKTWGGQKLADGCYVLATGNRPEHGASANKLPSQTLDRLLVVNVRPDGKQWLEKYAIPRKLHSTVIGFVRTMLAQNMDPCQGFDKDSFCGGSTPRSLKQLSDLEIAGLPDCEICLTAIVQGQLGLEMAQKYLAYRTLTDIDIDAILADPKNAAIPNEIDAQFAMIGFLSDVATSKNIQTILEFSGRLEPSMAVLLSDDIFAKTPKLKTSKHYKDILLKYGDLLS